MKGRNIMLRALLGSCLLCCGGGTPAGGVLIGTPPPPGDGASAASVAAAALKNGTGLAQNVSAGANKSGVAEAVKGVVHTDDKQTSNAIKTDDSYSLYRELMDMKSSLEDPNPQPKEGESEALRTVKSALRTILDTVRHSFLKGFLPTVERVRRDAEPEKKTYLNGVVYVVGSLLGKQSCSNMIACRTGKFVQTRVPGAQLAVMMAETFIPQSMLPWFGIFKTSVMDRSDNCANDFSCQLTEPQQQGLSDNTVAGSGSSQQLTGQIPRG